MRVRCSAANRQCCTIPILRSRPLRSSAKPAPSAQVSPPKRRNYRPQATCAPSLAFSTSRCSVFQKGHRTIADAACQRSLFKLRSVKIYRDPEPTKYKTSRARHHATVPPETKTLSSFQAQYTLFDYLTSSIGLCFRILLSSSSQNFLSVHNVQSLHDIRRHWEPGVFPRSRKTTERF